MKIGTTTLQKLFNFSGFKIANLVTDIEGSEFDIIDREVDILKNKIRTIIVEFHPNVVGQEKFDNTLLKLKTAGFNTIHQKESVFVLKNKIFDKQI